ncbi:hypothetical protein AQUCO_01400453v1 [Aquilegia coerulea]|uniref:MRN complex-interacting protein N-terminal domain-containing protein n=1 Tax=Aquilegia coerulea TaxID=218851 RepID=A0A2G5DWP0_AQUCA|nr:hypothetical protein AQUCO_01400453v1 [Aquilegia coerulea]
MSLICLHFGKKMKVLEMLNHPKVRERYLRVKMMIKGRRQLRVQMIIWKNMLMVLITRGREMMMVMLLITRGRKLRVQMIVWKIMLMVLMTSHKRKKIASADDCLEDNVDGVDNKRKRNDDDMMMSMVKQQKKLSNKWNCVICNEKQSVRNVFTRGFQAKDVRKFVQNFNMARQVADETLILPSEEIIDESVQINESCIEFNNKENKKRSNWSEYLDPEEQLEEERGELEEDGKGGDYGPLIVTELPKEMFKKPRLKNYSAGMNKTDGKKLYSPTFEKRKANNKPCNSPVKRSSAGLIKPAGKRLYSPTFGKRKAYDERSNTQGNIATRRTINKYAGLVNFTT